MPRTPAFPIHCFPLKTESERLLPACVTLAATAFLGFWLWRAATKTAGLGLGLIVGGALGNAYDRLTYGFVADFYHFHVGSFSWYVFNLADVAIVAGVAAFDLLISWRPAKKTRSPSAPPGNRLF